jgi:UPF0755 protein
MKQPINFIFFPLFMGIILLTWVIAGFFYYQVSVPAGNSLQPVIVNITPGATLKQISSNLKDQNLINNSIAFRLLANIRQKQTQIQIGEYKLNPSMLPIEILKTITTGKTVLHPVTIPEGYRITEIADLLVKKSIVNKDKFIKESKNKNLINSLNLKAKTLEGYLFPETYHFSKHTSEKKVVSVMLETFKKRLTNHNILDQIQRSKLSLHEVITLASLIEKETGQTEERKHISSVFHNRLKKNMRLQTDPTVIYAIKNFDGNIRKKDLSINSPYNTYRHKGLPPGPIASPGLQSIIAALNPIKTNHLYFVSRKDGSHHFSPNLKEHNQAVKKYQLRKVTR